MLTVERVSAGLVMTEDMERAVKAVTRTVTDPAQQRRALAIFRHAHALRLALEHWQHAEQ
jgi:hypothetical protein